MEYPNLIRLNSDFQNNVDEPNATNRMQQERGRDGDLPGPIGCALGLGGKRKSQGTAMFWVGEASSERFLRAIANAN